MSKNLIFSALLAIFIFSFQTSSGSNLLPDDEQITENESDSTDVLTVFSARIKDKTVYINWRLQVPRDVSYFEINRKDPKKQDFRKINDTRIQKDDFLEKTVITGNKIVYMYGYEDAPERDGVYYYNLTGYNSNGEVLFEADEIKIGITGIKNFKIEQNVPNPFNPVTNISYELFEASHVKLKVFDLIGKEIAVLAEGDQSKGTYTVIFDASKFSNLTSGIYFYKFDTGKYSEVKKMILTK